MCWTLTLHSPAENISNDVRLWHFNNSPTRCVHTKKAYANDVRECVYEWHMVATHAVSCMVMYCGQTRHVHYIGYRDVIWVLDGITIHVLSTRSYIDTKCIRLFSFHRYRYCTSMISNTHLVQRSIPNECGITINYDALMLCYQIDNNTARYVSTKTKILY